MIRSPRNAAKVAPRPFRSAVLGLVFGLLLGVGFALARHRLDTRLHDPADVAEHLGVPLLATIPELPKKLGTRTTS